MDVATAAGPLCRDGWCDHAVLHLHGGCASLSCVGTCLCEPRLGRIVEPPPRVGGRSFGGRCRFGCWLRRWRQRCFCCCLNRRLRLHRTPNSPRPSDVRTALLPYLIPPVVTDCVAYRAHRIDTG